MLAATHKHGKMDTIYYDTSFLIYNCYNRTGIKIYISNIQMTESNSGEDTQLLFLTFNKNTSPSVLGLTHPLTHSYIFHCIKCFPCNNTTQMKTRLFFVLE